MPSATPVALATADGEFAFRGVFHGDTIWLNAESSVDLHRVFGHELSHRMRQDNPVAYRALVDAVQSMLKNFGADYSRSANDDGTRSGNARRERHAADSS
ncbi:MAG TPA: hypothetical protein VGA88_03110 [Burkholderiales bacterium]